MKRRGNNLILAVSTLTLSVASFVVVIKGASDEPYTVFRQSDALVQIGVAMILMLLWLQLAAVIVAGVALRRVLQWWLFLLLWILTIEFYLFESPTGYVQDIIQYVSRPQ